MHVDEYECGMSRLGCVLQSCVSLFGGYDDHECYDVLMMLCVVLFGHLV